MLRNTILSIYQLYPGYITNIKITEQELTIHRQRFDFSLNFNILMFISNQWQWKNQNIRIEVDGEQHYDSTSRVNTRGDGFEAQYKRDKQKEKLCFDNNEVLIRTHQIDRHHGIIPNLDILINLAIRYLFNNCILYINIKNNIESLSLNGKSHKFNHSQIYDINIYTQGKLYGALTLDDIIKFYSN